MLRDEAQALLLELDRLWRATRSLGGKVCVNRFRQPFRSLLVGSQQPLATCPYCGHDDDQEAFFHPDDIEAMKQQFTKTQQRVLGVLFGQPERSFCASELIRDAGTGSGAAQRELAKLETSGLIVARRIGHQRHYQANATSPLYSELRNIVLK